MTNWIEFHHEWAYYIIPETFEMYKVRGKVPIGSIVLTKTQETLDNGITITNTDYSIAQDDSVVNLTDKREASKILATQIFQYMKKNNEYPPSSSFDKTFKNRSVDVVFNASDYDKFKIRLTPELVGDDPEEFLMNLRPASRKKFSPQDDWKVELAKSGRATCKLCGQKIDKNLLRIGEPTYFQDHLNYKWYHFDCKAEDIWGIGFRIADRIAKSLGIAVFDERRARAGLLFALNEATNDGHCYLTMEELFRSCHKLLDPDNEYAKRRLCR